MSNFALANRRRAPLFERQALFASCESSTSLHSQIRDGHRSSSDKPYLLRASLRQVCSRKCCLVVWLFGCFVVCKVYQQINKTTKC